MTDLDTLQALLSAAGLEEDCSSFQHGSLDWQSETLNDPAIVLDRLTEVIQPGATGWILFADRIAEVDGSWDPDWHHDYPLEAELALPGNGSLRLTHLHAEWILACAKVVPDPDAILETTSHRKLHGGTVVHHVAWTGDPLRPTSAALQFTSNS